jgi:hypothetical protein
MKILTLVRITYMYFLKWYTLCSTFVKLVHGRGHINFLLINFTVCIYISQKKMYTNTDMVSEILRKINSIR